MDGFEPAAPIQISIIARAVVVSLPVKIYASHFRRSRRNRQNFSTGQPAFILPSIYAKIVKDVCQENVEASPSSLRPFIKGRGRGETSSLFRERSSKSLHVTVFFHPPRQIVQETRHTLAGKNDRSMRCLSFSNRFYFIWKKGGEGWTRGSIESGNFGLFVCFCAKMQTIYPSTKGGWERIDRTEVGTNS